MLRIYTIIFIMLIRCGSIAQTPAGGLEKPESRLDQVASKWLGAPYAFKPLETGDDKSVVFQTNDFDCYTLVETALATIIASRQFVPIEEIIEKLRYRDGKADGYGSRIHYFTEWLTQAAEYGYIKNITPKNGTNNVKKQINYISSRQSRYPKAANPVCNTRIRNAELLLSELSFQVIPSAMIGRFADSIQTGDIIAFTSALPNLDVGHVGIAVNGPKGIHILHASRQNRKVEITTSTLATYTAARSSFSGIMVWRPESSIACP